MLIWNRRELRAPDFKSWQQPKPNTEQRTVDDIQPIDKPFLINNKAPTVLIVDDKEVQRSLVQMYLNQLGVNNLQANNGENAVEIFKANSIDLILMDIQMPVMNGFEASQIIKAHSPQVPIIALSGESGERELEMISKLMDGRLEKPTSLNALQQVISHWLNRDVVPNAHTAKSGTVI